MTAAPETILLAQHSHSLTPLDVPFFPGEITAAEPRPGAAPTTPPSTSARRLTRRMRAAAGSL
jgi:hypothetical protein